MKLAAALAMPLFALAIVTALEVAQSTNERDDVRSETNLAKASTGHQGLITTLQNERSWASVELVGQQDTYVLDTEGYDGTRAETDAAIAAFEHELAGEEEPVRDAFAPALDALDELKTVRADIDAFSGSKDLNNIGTANQIYARYSELIQPLLSANGLVVSAIDNPELRQGAAVVDLTTRQVEDQAELIRLTVVGVTLEGGAVDTAAEITGISQARATFERNNRDILDIGEPYASLVDELYPEEMVGQLSEQVDTAITTGHADVPTILQLISLPPDEGYGGMRDQLAEDVIARADDLSHAAEVRQRWFIVLAVTTLVAALAITWLVSRSITRPLRSLTRQATAMADHRLPEAVLDILETPLGEDVDVPEVDPVAVHTRDEVADVADALNTVQDTALDLAVEQAVLRRNIADSFVNLGRRNQNLLGRQLDFITELESNETSSDTLSNLFRLDHLATRMRRNAESLLVLAGVEPPRKWVAPVRLTDVIRAALGEVEDYQRVTVRGVEPATIVGAAAADLAHLLAELIENALVFSPPDQIVDIRGRLRPTAAPDRPRALPGTRGRRRAPARADDGDGERQGQGMYTLAIIDSGLGMSAADIEAANRRLAGAESFTIAPSKYLGHYVAGNLAARHGIAVRLDNSPGNGVTATVHIPPTLLTTDAVTSAPVTPPHGMRPSGVALPGGGPALPPPAAAEPQPQPAAPPPGRVAPAAPAWGPQQPAPASPGYEPAAAARSVFDGPASSGQEPPVWPPPPSPPTRTASGLVKRPTRPGDGVQSPAAAATHSNPNDDLLASLSRVAGANRNHGPAGPRSPGVADGWPPGPGQSSPPWAGPTGSAPGNRSFGLSPMGPVGGQPAGPPPASPSQAPPAPPLTRRVRGAQMPTTDPMQVRRMGAGGNGPQAPGGNGPQARGPAPGPQPPAEPDGRRSPDDVYSFLTSFTAGVQRGLDETNPHPGPPT
ncbi:MAG TPA: nitrate- and nitrite sensing domain-containing protein [Acidimicrobiales bacterium]|nr:nitrate- and nitrite sensing domain-containing protein [Acidimicrobiales bacterium]